MLIAAVISSRSDAIIMGLDVTHFNQTKWRRKVYVSKHKANWPSCQLVASAAAKQLDE
jgi:hypothetical protein